MSNDVRILLPVMVAIMLAKWVADAATHSLYHGLMEVKCVPFLPREVSPGPRLPALLPPLLPSLRLRRCLCLPVPVGRQALHARVRAASAVSSRLLAACLAGARGRVAVAQKS